MNDKLKSFLFHEFFFKLIFFLLVILESYNSQSSLTNKIILFSLTYTSIFCLSLVYVLDYFKEEKNQIFKVLSVNFIINVFHSFLYFNDSIGFSNIVIFQSVLSTVILFGIILFYKYKMLKFYYVEFNFGFKQNAILLTKIIVIIFVIYTFFNFEFIINHDFGNSLYFKSILPRHIILVLSNYFFFSILKKIKFSNLLKVIFISIISLFISEVIMFAFGTFDKKLLIVIWLIYALPISLIVFFVFNDFYKKTLTLKEISRLNIEKIKQSIVYQNLKNQINPHFLFNNLNTLISFIEVSPQKAIAFGHHLSNVYRHYLEINDNDFISLTNELNFIKDYLDIYKLKFLSNIDYIINCEINKSNFVLSNAMQEIIDNIFKHNILDSENKIFIEISCDDDYLTVKNNKNYKESDYSTKKGLSNITKRYEILTNLKIEIEDDNVIFTVKLPILKNID